MVSKKGNYVFIDSQNLNLGVRGQGWKLDWSKFRQYLRNKYDVSEAFLFIGYIKENQNLYNFLKKSDYDLIFKPTVVSKHEIKGNVDAELVLHSMIEFPNYKNAVIITGDGDFHCLIEYLDKKNKLEKIIIPNQKKYSQLLLKFKSYMDFMNNRRGKLGR